MTVRVAEQERAPFFTPKALAAYLALSERTVRDMLRHTPRRPPVLPSYRFEGARRIAAVDVDRYVEARKEQGQ